MESISYTGRDIEDIRQSLIDLVPQLTDDWKDFNESDLGITIIELIAGAQDMQNFYLDNQTFETYIDTAMQDKNIRSILRAMNYRIPLVISSMGEVTVEFNEPLENYLAFPKYTKFGSSESNEITYVSTDRIIAKSGSSSVNIPVIEGEVLEIKYTKNELLENLTPTNNVSRRVYLNDTMVADGTVTITQEGYVWEECEDALLKYRGGRYYSVHKDATGNVYVLMSVNFVDLLPVDGDEEITFTYIRSRGISGLVNAYKIDKITTAQSISSLIYKVYNEEAMYGAADEPNLQKAKLLAREHAQTLGRYVTLDDYANGVATEPTVMYSVVKDWKTLSLVKRPFTVFVWAVNYQGENLGKEERKRLINKFKSKGISAVEVLYQETEFIDFDISVVITLQPVTETESIKIQGAIEQYIRESLDVSKVDYGGRFSISLLTSSIYTISQYITSVVIENPTKDVESNEIQLLRLGSVSVRVEE